MNHDQPVAIALERFEVARDQAGDLTDTGSPPSGLQPGRSWLGQLLRPAQPVGGGVPTSPELVSSGCHRSE